MLRKIVFLIALSLIVAISSASVIPVCNQNDFDVLEKTVSAAASHGDKTITVNFVKGVYVYKDCHLTLSGLPADLKISFVGNGSRMIGRGVRHEEKFSPSYEYSYLDLDSYQPVNLWGETRQCNEIIEVVDLESKLCRIRLCNDDLKASFSAIKVSQWYTSYVYKVQSVHDGYVYFIADNLNYSDFLKGYNVNSDYYYGNSFPRYRLFPKYAENLYEETACNFISMGKNEIASLSVSGFEFDGCAYSSWQGLISFSHSGCYVSVSDCVFKGCSSVALIFSSMSGITVCNNTFAGNHVTCVKADNACSNVSVTSNQFLNNGLAWTNSFCIESCADNFEIADNRISDFSYGAIGFGVWFAAEKKFPVTGVVENNEIWYSDSYLKDKWKHTLMDSGAIYSWTQNDNVVVRYNHIHDYAGMADNRGIFCDDGTCNVTLLGNVVTGIGNSMCIDLRYVPSVLSSASSKTDKVNIGNSMLWNIVDGPVRFEVVSGEEDSSHHTLICTGESGGKAILTHDQFAAVRHSPVWGHVRNIIKQK